MDFLTDDVKGQLVKLIEDGLEFVEVPTDLLCSNCCDILLFHYVCPCSHPYCRDCYADEFPRHKTECEVCRNEMSDKMLQSEKIELAIYKLNVFCPNYSFGCTLKMSLDAILGHLEECKYSKEKRLRNFHSAIIDKMETKDLKDLEASNEELRQTITELVQCNQDSNNKIERLAEENGKLSKQMIALQRQMKQTTIHSRESDKTLIKHAKSLEHKMQLFLDRIATDGRMNYNGQSYFTTYPPYPRVPEPLLGNGLLPSCHLCLGVSANGMSAGQQQVVNQKVRQNFESIQEHHQPPLTSAMLARALPSEQKQMLGERLFPLIQLMHPDLAGKVTGMLLEIDNSELLHMLQHRDSLVAKVEEAVGVLEAHRILQQVRVKKR